MGRIGDLILGTYGVLMVIVTTPFLNMVALDSSGSMHSENYFFLSISLIVMYFSHFYLYKVFFGVKKGADRIPFYRKRWFAKTIAGFISIFVYSFVISPLYHREYHIYSSFDVEYSLTTFVVFMFFFMLFYVVFGELLYECVGDKN